VTVICLCVVWGYMCMFVCAYVGCACVCDARRMCGGTSCTGREFGMGRFLVVRDVVFKGPCVYVVHVYMCACMSVYVYTRSLSLSHTHTHTHTQTLKCVYFSDS